ncbi:MAG: hypothetical protein JNL74_03535, partial [Fibrobacteres bacterium]|nr:hypothetical protein [Fibrobacterota bacterium]
MGKNIVAIFVLLFSFVNISAQSTTALQDSFLTLRYGAFLHFNMGTFTGQEWATEGQNPSLFNP